MSPKDLKAAKAARAGKAHADRRQPESGRADASSVARAQADVAGRDEAGRPRPAGATALLRGRRSAVEHGPARLLAHLPRSKLTALGNGLLACTVMLLVGCVCTWLLGASTATYGVCFLLLSVACALWVRIADALTAPVAVPIAFAFGLLPMSEGEGIGAWFVELATTLAINAGWLYGGTLLAAVIVVVRRGMLAARRRRDRRSPARRP